MRRLFTMMASQVQSTVESLRRWWSTLSPDPSTWVPFTWVLAALVMLVLLVLILRPRRSATARRPELLISHGELRFIDAPGRVSSSLRAPKDGTFQLSMTVSNLSAVPVQLLELAVRTNGSPAPTTAEVPAVLPPHGAVEVSAELREAGGDEGTLELFVYVPDMPPKTFRVRARLRWEPWNARFRVLPLDQKVEPTRGLTERGLRRREAARRPRVRGSSQRAATAPRTLEAGFPEAALEREVRFEPRPESARPRSSRPGAADVREPYDAAASEREASRGMGRAPRTGPGGSSAGTPGDTVVTWPPRRPRSPLSPSAETPAETPAPRPAEKHSEGRSAAPMDRTDRDMQPWEAQQRDARRREAETREAETRERERRESERREQVRREQVLRDQALREKARRDAERAETERREAERRERERREAQRAAEVRAAEVRASQARAAGQRPRDERAAERAAEQRAARERTFEQRTFEQRPGRGRGEGAKPEGEPVRPEPVRPEPEHQDRVDGTAGERRDAGHPDAGHPDAGHADAEHPDAARPDAGRPDAGRPDAARPDRSDGARSTADEDEKPRPRLEFPDEF